MGTFLKARFLFTKHSKQMANKELKAPRKTANLSSDVMALAGYRNAAWQDHAEQQHGRLPDH